MVLSDFEFGGYVTLSTFLRIEVLEHAEALDDFLQEHDLVQESFRVAGPGLYYILVDKGWDRGGDSPAIIIKKVPDGVPTVVEYLQGLALVCGGEHFAVIPLLPDDWEQRQAYRHSLDNVPYWDGAQRLSSLDLLLYSLSQGWTIPATLDDAVDAEDDEFFAGIPEVAYTGQQPEDHPLPEPLEWEPEPEPTPPAGLTPDEWFANQHTLQHAQVPAYIGKIYPWTFWYRGGDGEPHQMLLEATYEDAQRVWDKLITTLDMTSKRP